MNYTKTTFKLLFFFYFVTLGNNFFYFKFIGINFKYAPEFVSPRIGILFF